MKKIILSFCLILSLFCFGFLISGCVDTSNNSGYLVFPEISDNQDNLPNPPYDPINSYFESDVIYIKDILLDGEMFNEEEITIQYQANSASLICSSQNLGLEEYGKINNLLRNKLEIDVYDRLSIKLENGKLYIILTK